MVGGVRWTDTDTMQPSNGVYGIAVPPDRGVRNDHVGADTSEKPEDRKNQQEFENPRAIIRRVGGKACE